MFLKIDNSNRRIKNLVDTELLFIARLLDEKNNFSKDDIIILDERFKDICKELNKIDKNITEVKLKTTGEVSVNETLKELNIDKSTVSSNRIREVLYGLLNELVDTSEDFYTQVITTLCLVGGLCEIYLNNINITDNKIDFKEVENRYE
ncbi:MAG: hypothetical protein IJG68_05625 [Bacilli bacterium]|nr:hypothetical protein [Bacilli bacterium]